MRWMHKVLACVIALSLTVPVPTLAQQEKPAAPFKAEELDQLAAPIALYTDPLLAQVLMASTYPLEIVQAARFAKENASLKGSQLDEALKKQTWDDSVKSLVAFPQVLSMMDAKLEWAQKLGDAFLAQQKELMAAVQRLRARAHAEGNLKTTAEQKVTVEPAQAAAAPAAATPAAPVPAPQTVVVQQAPPTVIVIQQANPQVVYVPTYNPAVVYGAWPYPAYPPYAYYPPGYVAGAAMFSFAAGVAVGSALWGNCNWHGGDVNVNVSQHNNYTKNVNTANVASQRTQIQNTNAKGGSASTWQHNAEHRKGAQYRDPATQQKFNKAANPQATQARESFRGRADQGRQELGQAGTQQAKQSGAANRPATAQTRDAGGAQGGGGARPAATTTTLGQGQGSSGGGAFDGMGKGGEVQQASNRGQASRQSMNAAPAGGTQGKAAATNTRSGGGSGGGGGARRR